MKVGDFGLVTAHSSEHNMDIPLAGECLLNTLYLFQSERRDISGRFGEI